MESPQANESFTLRQGIGLAVGLVVGSGLLALPGMALEQGGPSVASIAWIAIVLSVIPLIEIFSALSLRFPTAEGLAFYAQIVLGAWARQGVAWVMVAGAIFGLPVLAMVGGSYLARALGLSESWDAGIAAAILIGVSGLNLLNARVLGRIGFWAAGFLVCLTLALFLTNLRFVAPGLQAFQTAWTPGVPVSYAKIGHVTTLLFWAFLGWENLSSCTTQLENPKRNIRRVYYGSFILVSVLYLALALIAIGANGTGLRVDRADGLAALARTGTWSNLLTFGMAAVILANANSWIFSFSRFMCASAREGSVPAIFGRTDRNGTPTYSIILLLVGYLAVLAIMSTGALTNAQLVLFVDQAFLVLYAIAIAAYFRSESGKKRWLVSGAALVPFALLGSCFDSLAVIPAALLLASKVLAWGRAWSASRAIASPERIRPSEPEIFQVAEERPVGGFFLTVKLPFAATLEESQLARDYGVSWSPLSSDYGDISRESFVQLKVAGLEPAQLKAAVDRLTHYVESRTAARSSRTRDHRRYTASRYRARLWDRRRALRA